MSLSPFALVLLGANAPLLALAPSVQTGGCSAIENAAVAFSSNLVGSALQPLVNASDGATGLDAMGAHDALLVGLAETSALFQTASIQAQMLQQFGIDLEGQFVHQLEQISNEFGAASYALSVDDWGVVASSVDAAACLLEDTIRLKDANGLPIEISTAFDSGIARFADSVELLALHGTAQTGQGEALAELYEGVFSFHAAGTDAILAELLEPEYFEWSSVFSAEVTQQITGDVGRWQPGADDRVAIDHEVARGVLDELAARGLPGMLAEYGPQAALVALGDGAADVSGSLATFATLLTLPDFQCFFVGRCAELCTIDPDSCGDCYISGVGFGSAVLNPTEIRRASKIVKGLAWIPISRNFIPSPSSGHAIRKAIGKAFEDLAGKVVANSGNLWVEFANPYCYRSRCYVFWRESWCLDKKEWVLIELPLTQRLKKSAQWNNADWDRAADKTEEQLEEWCGEDE